MFKKFFFIFLTIVNLVALYATQYFTGLVPFYIEFGCFFVTCVLVLLVNQFTRSYGSSLSNKIEKMIENGKDAYFLTFLAVVDTLIFMMIVPQESLTLLENEYQISFIFYGLIIFFIPIIIVKFIIEPYGKDIENLFWSEYLAQIRTNKPSMAFALFILARIQVRANPLQSQQKSIDQQFDRESFTSDQVSTTTFPIDYTTKVDSQELTPQNQNSLFDSNDDLAEDNVFDKYLQEIYQLLPDLEKLTLLKPIRVRPELFLNIIIEKTYRDPQMIQFFKDCT